MTLTPIGPLTTGIPVLEIDGVGTPEGIRTMGRAKSMLDAPIRDITESAGDLIPSLIVEAPIEDFRLIAMLGVYTLPYMLGRRLPWKLPLPRPR